MSLVPASMDREGNTPHAPVLYTDFPNGCVQVTEYLERLSDVRGLSKMALRRVEHLYYKNDLVYGAMRKLVQQQQAATAQQTSQTQQEGSDEAVEAEDLDEEETEAKQVLHSCKPWLCQVLLCWVHVVSDRQTDCFCMGPAKTAY